MNIYMFLYLYTYMWSSVDNPPQWPMVRNVTFCDFVALVRALQDLSLSGASGAQALGPGGEGREEEGREEGLRPGGGGLEPTVNGFE